MPEMRMFIPLTKADAVKRLVYGVAALEQADKAGEVFDYDSSKPLIQKWSDEIATATGGKSLGNVRAMHGKVAAGVLKELEFNDSDKMVEVCAHIVDDNEWEKVETGTYTGFSIGGSYVKKWDNGDGLKRYTASPTEISIVDNPAMPGAHFALIKMDGAVDRPFATYQPAEDGSAPMITNEMVVARAQEIAKAAGSTTYADFIGPAREALEKAMDPGEGAHADASGVGTMPTDGRAKIKPVNGSVPNSNDTDNGTAPSDEELSADQSQPKGSNPGNTNSPDPRAGGGPIAKDLPTNVDPRNEVTQGWQAKDGSFHISKAAALAHNDSLAKAAGPKSALETLQDAMSAAGAVLDKAAKPKDDPEDKAKIVNDGKDGGDGKEKADAKGDGKEKADAKAKDGDKPAFLGKFAWKGPLEKGMYSVSRLAGIIESLEWLGNDCFYEADWEGDNSPVPEKIKSLALQLGAVLGEMVAEEVGEMFSKSASSDQLAEILPIGSLQKMAWFVQGRKTVMLEKSASIPTGFDVIEEGLAKALKAAHVVKMQEIHDHACEMGAKCASAPMGKAIGLGGQDLDTLRKGMEVLSDDNGALAEGLEKAVGMIGQLAKKLDDVLSQPAAQPPVRNVHAIEKGQDLGSNGDVTALLAKMSPETLATAAIGLIQRGGGQRVFPGAMVTGG